MKKEILAKERNEIQAFLEGELAKKVEPSTVTEFRSGYKQLIVELYPSLFRETTVAMDIAAS